MMIRLQIPELTEERRKELGKQAREIGEEGKIAVRKVRQEANDALKKEQKDGDITEDEFHRDRDEVQKLTDRFCEQIDKIVDGQAGGNHGALGEPIAWPHRMTWKPLAALDDR